MIVYTNSATVGTRLVGYSLSKRNGVYQVNFDSPDGSKRLRKSTGMTREDLAFAAAPKIIAEAYEPSSARSFLTWDSIEANLEETLKGKSEDTVRNYRVAIRHLRKLVDTNGPDDITFQKCQEFQSKYFATPFVRAKGQNANKFMRKSSTFDTSLRHLRSLWNRWLNRRTRNPWMDLPMIGGTKRKDAPAKDTVLAFVKWVEETKYPGWKLPSLFIRTKAFLGCRLWDLCSAKSKDLKDGKLTLHDRKQGTPHTVAITNADLYRELQEIAGPTFLFEKYTVQLRAHLEATKQKVRVVNQSFTVESLYSFVSSLFTDWTETQGKKLTSHDLRRYAVTSGYDAGARAEELAKRIGMKAATLIKYYLDMDKLKNSDMSKVDAALSI